MGNTHSEEYIQNTNIMNELCSKLNSNNNYFNVHIIGAYSNKEQKHFHQSFQYNNDRNAWITINGENVNNLFESNCEVNIDQVQLIQEIVNNNIKEKELIIEFNKINNSYDRININTIIDNFINNRKKIQVCDEIYVRLNILDKHRIFYTDIGSGAVLVDYTLTELS